MSPAQKKHLDSLLSSSDRALAGMVASLMVSKRVKSPQEAERKAKLALAVEAGDTDSLKAMLAKGMSPNDPVFDTCLLSMALMRGKIGTVRVLLANGANPNPKKGATPLSYAVGQQNVEIAKLLISAGAKLNIRQPTAQPVLLSACLTGCEEMVDLLISNGAKTGLHGTIALTQSRHVRRVTPLMAAAFVGGARTVDRLLIAGARHETKDTEGCTALDWAGRCQNIKATRQISAALQAVGTPKGDGTAKMLVQTPDFLARSATKHFKQCVRDLSTVVGAKPHRLKGSRGDVVGGYTFALHEPKAQKLAVELRKEFLKKGIFLFTTHQGLAMLPTTDPLEAVTAVGTSGQKCSVDDVTDWLRSLAREGSYEIQGIGLDYIQGRFKKIPSKPARLAKQIAKLCNSDDSRRTILSAARQIKDSRQFFLWWD